MADKSTQDNDKKRKRGAFPRLPLKKILELCEAVFTLGVGERVRRLEVFDHLGRKPNSGASRQLITISNGGYGLISGGYKAEFLELTELGKNIVASKDESSRLESIYLALFSNTLFDNFISNFGNRQIPPSDSVFLDYLTREHDLSSKDAQACWEVFKENMSDYQLIRELSGNQIIHTKESAFEAIKKSFSKPTVNINSTKSTERNKENEKSQSKISNAEPISLPTSSTNNNPQFHFNIEIHLPNDATSDQYDAIFKSISKHLLGRNEDS